MLVVGVNGSPKSASNTAYLLRSVLRGAADAGAATEQFDLRGMRISDCTGCMGCKKTGACTIGDDMGRFYETVPRLGALVLATPVYFDHVSGWLKCFMDRLYCYLDADYRKLFPRGVRAGVVMTYELDDREETAYNGVVEWIAGRLKGYYDMQVVGSVVASGCAGKLVVDGRPDVLRRAGELGWKLAVDSNVAKE